MDTQASTNNELITLTKPERHHFSYHGVGSDLAIVMLKNIILTIITFGIYSPWARTNTRRFFWSNTAFKGDRFTYTGTGKELFKGWIKVFGIFFLFAIGVQILMLFLPKSFKPAAGLFMLPIYIYIFSIAIYSGLRYRALRTLWRQIRFNVVRNKELVREFTLLFAKGSIFSGLTFGIYLPYFTNQKHHFLFNKISYGGIPFSYDGEDKEYFMICIKGFFLSLITLGIYTPWFFLNRFEYRLSHTHIGNNSFHIALKGEKFLVYGLVSYFGTLLSFGLALPWIINWGLSLVFDNTYLEGPLDLSGVKNEAGDESATGEDLVSAYDLDLGF